MYRLRLVSFFFMVDRDSGSLRTFARALCLFDPVISPGDDLSKETRLITHHETEEGEEPRKSNVLSRTGIGERIDIEQQQPGDHDEINEEATQRRRDVRIGVVLRRSR